MPHGDWLYYLPKEPFFSIDVDKLLIHPYTLKIFINFMKYKEIAKSKPNTYYLK